MSSTTDCLDDEEVAALLEGALAGRERERVDEHLDGCSSCRKLLAAASASLGDGAETPLAGGRSEATLRERGATLGRYVVLDVLGAGGMGVVYAAYDPELDRRVAVKVLRTAWAVDREELRARIQREAQAMARIAHPNVAAVYDVGEHRGEVFVVMELLEGTTLARWAHEARRSRAEILSAFTRAGRGLAAAHSAGLVHRDFKPENVLIGKDGRVAVTDFGIARLRADPGAPRTEPARASSAPSRPSRPSSASPSSQGDGLLAEPLTRTDVVLGTPAYMAPEQHTGGAVDARTDEFSFCVALWEALFGARPFAGSTLKEILAAIQRGELREPAGADVPARVRRALARGLAASPEARFPSMDELLLALEPPAWIRSWRLIAASAVAVAISLGIGVFVERTLSARAASCAAESALLDSVWSPEVRRSVEQAFAGTHRSYAAASSAAALGALDAYADAWRTARVETCEATRVRREQPEETMALRMACLDDRRRELGALAALFAAADAATVEGAARAAGTLTPVSRCADVAALAVPVPRPTDPALKERLETALARVTDAEALARVGKSDRAMPIAAAAVAELEAIGHAPSLAYGAYTAAIVAVRLGKVTEAERYAQEALLAAQRGRDDQWVINALEALTQITGAFAGRTEDGLRYSRLALATIERIGGDQEDITEVRDYRSLVLAAAGRLEEALVDASDALASSEATRGPNHPTTIETRSNLGNILVGMGRLEEARARFSEAVRAFDAVVGPGNPESLQARGNLGWVLLLLGRVDEAAPMLEAVLDEYRRRTPGEGDPNLSAALTNLGELRLAQGRPAEALAFERESIAILEALSREHPGLCEPLTQEGLALAKLGRLAEALLPIERALALGKAAGIPPTDLARVELALAEVLTAAHRDAPRVRQLATHARDAWLDAAKRFGGENHRFADEAARFLAR